MIKIENVEKVYSGRPGCACGCRGQYYQDGPMLKKVVALVNARPPIEILHGSDGSFVWIDCQDENGEIKRTYTVYLKEKVS